MLMAIKGNVNTVNKNDITREHRVEMLSARTMHYVELYAKDSLHLEI